ncbi:hypothetical protein NE865_07469 [Phthorimaea operculella]|nr:hypothetical protein NE865_07469 [Phthorimaea operculella]
MWSIRNYAKAAYEGEGKTTVRVINQDYDLGLMIDSYATYGFRLNNGVTVLGPMAIFPRTALAWTVRGSEEINQDSLRFFRILEPKIDLLVIGLETKERSSIDTLHRRRADPASAPQPNRRRHVTVQTALSKPLSSRT